MKHSFFTYNPANFSSMTIPVNAVNEAMLTERMLGHFSPLEITPEAFKKAYELAIGEHVEKNYKGLSYLSWPFAFRYLNEQFPGTFVAFEEKEAGWPVFGREGCWLLRPYLTDGIRRTPALVFPIMDNKHNAVKELDARQVSDNIQRASVKCIATFTGLGLKLYAGEDIPTSDEETPSKLSGQQAPQKQTSRGSTKEAPAPKVDDAAGAAGTASPSSASQFDGKGALLSFCKTNPLDYADERTSMMAGKRALEAIGLAKGEDIKDGAMFANVVTTMVSSFMSENGIKMAKSTMAKELDTLRAICEEGTVEQAVQGVKVLLEGKK